MALASLAPVIAATWPPLNTAIVGAFTVPHGGGGGNRVSAVRLTDPEAGDATEADIDAALSAQAKHGQSPLFMVLDQQGALDAKLQARGLLIRDTTIGMIAPTANLAEPPPPVTCFTTWPPLAIQEEIWTAGGIGKARWDIMARATGPKISLFGRINDKPAATAYLAVHDGVAMLHALEVAESHRRKGLAATMMKTAAFWAVSQRAGHISVLVTQANAPARALYSSLGFQAVGQYHYRSNSH